MPRASKPLMREEVYRVLHLVTDASATGSVTLDRLSDILSTRDEPRFLSGKDIGISRARRVARLLEEQRLLENIGGLWRETALGAVWRVVIDAWNAGAEEVPYDLILRDPQLDRFSAKTVMTGISSGNGKQILQYQPRKRVVALGVYDPTLGD